MEIILEKQPEKYLRVVDRPTLMRLRRALDKLQDFEGDIRKLTDKQNEYRLKIYHYRILFTYDKATQTITVTEIGTRTNIKY